MRRLAVLVTTMGVFAGSIYLSAQVAAPPALKVEQEAINPWTNLDFAADPAQFQFAIVTDRTGGHRALVFENAIKKLNLLRPEFVISVGDLIEGYTTDQSSMQQQWEQFQKFVNALDMPFFYVPGNHDISNVSMEKEWKERLGRPYYHFVYKNVLFLAVNSEASVAQEKDNLGKEQLEYFDKVLKENDKVRWTLAFLHKPLWTYGPDKMGAGTGWLEMEELLKGRNYTVFCGHHHRYQTWIRNGQRYIQLATTGGGSKMRGKPEGEFDQIAWMTMTDDGPVLANVLLDGVIDFNIQGDLAFEAQMAKEQEIQRIEREKAEAERKKAREAKKKAAALKKAA